MLKQLDRQFLLNYYQDMADEIGPVFEVFMDEVPGSVAEIKKMLEAHQFAKAKAIIHGIVPSFTSVGLPQLSAQLRKVEDTAAANEADSIDLMVDFENEFTAYLPAIQAELDRLNNLM